MIKIKNLTLKFDNKCLFENKDINFEENKINIITGLNGIGKTSILKVIAGLIKTSSKVEIQDKKIFYLPQIINYPKNINLYEYLSSTFYSHWKWRLSKCEKDRVMKVMQEVELLDKKDLLIENLSSGELQKANIALGILSGAELFLLDEPTSNMDIINQIKILNIIKKLTQKGLTAIVILHDINLASSYGDYFIGVTPENNILCQTKEEFFTEENLYNIYNVKFKVINDEKEFHIQIFG